MFGPKTNQQYICDSTGICEYTAEGSNKPTYSSPNPQNSILSSVGKHLYDNSFAYGLGAAAIGTAAFGPDLSTIYQFGRSLIYDPLPLTPVQQGLLESGEIWEQLPAKLISPLIALNQFVKYNFAHRFDANNQVSRRNHLIRKRQAYKAATKIQTYLSDMKRKRSNIKRLRNGVYPGTVQSDGQYRYGLGRMGRKALFRIPTFDCSPDDEIKWVDYTKALTQADAGDIVFPFTSVNVMDRGTSSSTRVGQRAKIHAFELKVTDVAMHRNDPSTDPNKYTTNAYIVELWYDAQCNGSAATAGNVYVSNAYKAFPNMDNTSRFFPVWSTGEIQMRPFHLPDTSIAPMIVTGKHNTIPQYKH